MATLLGRKKAPAPDTLDVVASTLVTVGAVNWGLVGLFNLDLVATLFGRRSLLSKLVYVAVGASAVYLVSEAAAD
ncbi:MAG: DUF378 domain-containing protein [Actinomycetota bacterium]